MLKHIGAKSINLEKIISEIYKINTAYISKVIENEREKEIALCRDETTAIINSYKEVLNQAIVVVIDSVLNDVEKVLFDTIPSFKNNASFLMGIIEHEIKIEYPIGFELDFSQVTLTTGTDEHYSAFKDILNVNFDESLGESSLIFNYKDIVKTIDFSNLSSNITQELRECRKKYLDTLGLNITKN